jgi:hypothetical protein
MVVKAKECECKAPMLCLSASTPSAGYRHAGHARKLAPIIENLSRLDFSQEPWSEIKQRIETMEASFEAVLLQIPANSPQRPVVCELLEAARAALSAQNDLFSSHRRLCVSALQLRS